MRDKKIGVIAKEPLILAHARTEDGIAYQLRRDPIGVLDVPGLENTLLSIHIGAPSKISCLRDGRNFTGTAAQGDIDIIPAGTSARWQVHDENDETLLISLPQRFLGTMTEELGIDISKLSIHNCFQVRDHELENLSWAMKRELESGRTSGKFYLEGLAIAAASRMVTQYSSHASRHPKVHLLDQRAMKRVMTFVEDHLAEDLSLERLASVAGVSVSHFKTVFRRAASLSIHQYVIQRRVERAKRLLLSSHLSIADVALATGFAHQSHMARHMRRASGISPLALKRLLTTETSLTK
jgi:AraC family transcriptional regulator